MDLGLKGKVAIVTGAGSQIGFGKAISLGLAKEGCNVVAADIDLEGAKKTAAEIEALGQKAIAYKCDVTSAADWEAMFKDTLDKLGKLDILVNNAGGCTPPRPFLQMTDENWKFDIDINLTSTRLGTKTVMPYFVERKSGNIVNVTSGAGIHGGPFTTGYSAAKAGIIGFTMATSLEAAPHGIRINAVSPGVADTGFAKNAPPGMIDNYLKTVPLGRLTTPEDIANGVIFFASDMSSDIIGQVLVITGNVQA